MNKPFKRFPIKPISLAVLAAVSLPSAELLAQDASEEQAIEEVVATGTRLKGTATAVLEERKNQAFVADILGAEQISRTGDGDAAAALCGKGFGRVKVGDKTLEGAIGCFLLCFLLTFLFPYLPNFLSKWGEEFTWMHMVLFPLGISLLELFPIKLGRLTFNDNLYVPAAISLLVLI